MGSAVTNLSSTRRMVRALRQSEQLVEGNMALATLALATAKALDDAVATGAQPYAIDRLARAHLGALKALDEVTVADTGDDPFTALLAEMGTPTRGDGVPTLIWSVSGPLAVRELRGPRHFSTDSP